MGFRLTIFLLCFFGEGNNYLFVVKSIKDLSVQICDVDLVIATAES